MCRHRTASAFRARRERSGWGPRQGTFRSIIVPGTDAREEPEGSNSIRFRLGDDVEAARSRQGERTKRYADEADDEANEDGAPR